VTTVTTAEEARLKPHCNESSGNVEKVNRKDLI
jgi:hypothetical protein